jgi:hypothetical protein
MNVIFRTFTYLSVLYKFRGLVCAATAVAYWLRHYDTNRKVAGSRPDDVNDFYQEWRLLGCYTVWLL